MKQRTVYIIIGILVFILIIIGYEFYYQGPKGAPAVTVPTTVHFGNPGTCMGGGVCNCVAVSAIPLSGYDTNVVHVKFSTLPGSPNVFLMSFSMTDLQMHAPGQVQYFKSGSYAFPNAFPLSDTTIFPTSLSLPPGA